MTWQGGKTRTEPRPSSPFARLKPLAGEGDDPSKGLELLARALSDYPSPLRLEVRLVSGGADENIEHWQIEAGSKDARPQLKQPDGADVIVVMRHETWMEIVQGRLAPYDALYTGRLRVGGDFEAAKAITRSLSDPSSPYLPPC
jgi:SCP-2 sterol transfer family